MFFKDWSFPSSLQPLNALEELSCTIYYWYARTNSSNQAQMANQRCIAYFQEILSMFGITRLGTSNSRLSGQKVKARYFFCSVSRKYRRARRLFRNSSTAKATRNTCHKWSTSLPYCQCVFTCLARVLLRPPTAARVMAVTANSCAGARPQFLCDAQSFHNWCFWAEAPLCAGRACVSVSSGIHVSFPEPEAPKH